MHKPDIRALGRRYERHVLPDVELLLQSCEAGFRYGRLQLYQVLSPMAAEVDAAVTADVLAKATKQRLRRQGRVTRIK